MNSADGIFFGLMCGATLWLALLSAGARVNARWQGRAGQLVLGIATMLLLFIPLGGLPVWSWVFTFCPNPSLPMLGMVCATLWQHLCGVTVFKPADWRATWIFGAVMGTALYVHPLVLPAIDLYYWGWDRELAVWTLAALAVAFLAAGNRLGVLLFASLLAYQLGALESKNCWDYVIDPFYWLTSLVLGATQGILRCVSYRRAARAIPTWSRS